MAESVTICSGKAQSNLKFVDGYQTPGVESNQKLQLGVATESVGEECLETLVAVPEEERHPRDAECLHK